MSIYKKLAEAKKEIGKIAKDSKNPFFKSSYLSLNGLIDAVEPILEKHKLVLLQPISDGQVTTIIVDIENEDVESNFIESSIQLPTLTDAQKLGSAITYFRRYTLQSLLALQAEDDDGNLATKKDTDRPQALTDSQYQNLLLSENHKHIPLALKKYRMATNQREKLEELVK